MAETMLEKRARRLIEADERVKRETRRAFPHGECSYDPRWQEAVRELDAERKASSLMLARGLLALVAARTEGDNTDG